MTVDWPSKSVLITGGTGSLGRALVRRLLRREQPRRVIVYSRDELKQHDMAAEFTDPRMRFFLGDVRDADRLRTALEDVQIVVHAAALKHVPACEYNAFEAVKTNVIGSQNVVAVCVDRNVERAVLVSTDKAPAPCTLYGATKFLAERLFLRGNAYARRAHPAALSAVRYGNVFGSRGSVVWTFLRQHREGKPLTVTDPKATRFWITLEQAVEFVLSSVERMRGGEVFVPDVRASTVGALAEAIGGATEVVGLRSAEKLHEVLVSADEVAYTERVGDRYVVRSEAVALPIGEALSSATAPRATLEELRQMVKEVMSKEAR